jgi:hypothetical protein
MSGQGAFSHTVYGQPAETVISDDDDGIPRYVSLKAGLKKFKLFKVPSSGK